MSSVRPEIKAFFHASTSTLTYAVVDRGSGRAAVIDPALDYDPASARTGTVAADEVIAWLRAERLTLEWILETHAHADHLSGAQQIKRALGGKVAIGEGIRSVQAHFRVLFGVEAEVPADGSQFDHLFRDGETFRIGGLECRALHTPGHTDDSLTYLIGDAAFVGDTMFMPDGGTARCDFPGGDARKLYRSLQRILALPADTRLFMCHDYQPGGRELRYETTIAAERAGNAYLKGGASEEQFVAMRLARDAVLGMPTLILPALQVNIRGGRLPPAGPDGIAYLKIPLDQVGKPIVGKE